MVKKRNVFCSEKSCWYSKWLKCISRAFHSTPCSSISSLITSTRRDAGRTFKCPLFIFSTIIQSKTLWSSQTVLTSPPLWQRRPPVLWTSLNMVPVFKFGSSSALESVPSQSAWAQQHTTSTPSHYGSSCSSLSRTLFSSCPVSCYISCSSVLWVGRF